MLKINSNNNGGTFQSLRPPISPFSLSFKDKAVNADFEEEITRRSVDFVRVSLMLAIGLYIFFSILDRIVTPEIATPLMVIRIISCLFFVGCIYLTYTEIGVTYFQLLMSATVLFACSGIIIMTLMADAIGEYHYYAGLILAIMYAHGLLRMHFLYASVTTWLVIFGYIAATLFTQVTPSEVYTNNIFFLASANIMGMFASYWLEYYMKTSYFNEQILSEQSKELEKEIMRKSQELQTARDMQLNMLPQDFPYCPDYQFSFSMKPASEVGGDFYDYHRASDTTLTFGIGDATGHGLQSSVMVTAIKLLFTEHAANSEIVDFLKRASHCIKQMEFHKIYMAFAIGRLTYNTLELAGAGMPPAFIYRAHNKHLEEIPLKGLPLGSKAKFPYSKTSVHLDPKDTVILMTDGLPELFNGNGTMFGYDHVSNLIMASAHKSPLKIIEDLHSAAEKWLNGNKANDDMTFFVFQRKPVKIKDNIPQSNVASPAKLS